MTTTTTQPPSSSSWPTLPTGEPVNPTLAAKWQQFLAECHALGSEVRNVECRSYTKPDRVSIRAEVRRLGTDYGEVYWRGYLDYKDDDENKFTDEEKTQGQAEVPCGGWGDPNQTHTAVYHAPREGSPFSDRGHDKVGWFGVHALESICILLGEHDEQKGGQKHAFYYSPTKPCTPLDAILRLPGPGLLSLEWNTRDNPMWH